MDKLTLDLDDLRVETFSTGLPETTEGGSVHAQAEEEITRYTLTGAPGCCWGPTNFRCTVNYSRVSCCLCSFQPCKGPTTLQ